MDASTCAKVWFSSITRTTCPECGTLPPGVGVGNGRGTGVGVGCGVEPGVGVGPGVEARLLWTPPQPAASSMAETTAVKMRAFKLAFEIKKRMKPPGESWRLRAELLCLH